jgi:glucose/arabinose dehydrogenase
LFIFSLLAVPASGQTVPAGFSHTEFAAGLPNGTAMAFAPDGRLFVCQQTGQLRVIEGGILVSTPFLTVNVDASGERGLLGIAFDPSFVSNYYVYIYYTVPGPPPHNRVSRFTASGNEAVALSEFILMELEDLTASNHNGGALAFGPDGKLYIAVGENATPGNAQTLSNRLGKILRINSDGTIPDDNPFLSTTGANPAIWALGLRNPFSFTFQPFTGRMLINDVGQNATEEINEGLIGANYGWPTCEGPCIPSNPSFRDPIYFYGHNATNTQGCAITSGVFYNPSTVQFPSNYLGKYFFVDLCGAWMNYIDPTNPPTINGATVFATSLGGFPVAVQVGPDGSLYYLSRTTSAVWRISYPTVTKCKGGCLSGVLKASPNPIPVCDGSGLGSTTLSYVARGTASVEIRRGSPSGPLVFAGGATGSVVTGKTVSDNTTFYLQNVAGGLPLTSANTLSTVKVRVKTSGCP